jgi:hypothetical protein
VCVSRKHCDLCNKGFCDTHECSAPMDKCTHCGRLVCDGCKNTQTATRACAGRSEGCMTRCCPACATLPMLRPCARCKLQLCGECQKKHRGRDCRRPNSGWQQKYTK